MREFAPQIAAITEHFPKFGSFLKKRVRDIDTLEPAAAEAEITAAEQGLGVSLPDTYKRFLRCTKSLTFDVLSIGSFFVFPHPAKIVDAGIESGSICIADYWLEADGDQVLVECRPKMESDPPVYYYAHAEGPHAVRKLANSFSAWIELLPRSPVFRQ